MTVFCFMCMLTKEELKDKIRSVLFSLAYGDAFGMPTEMMSFEEIKARIGYVDQFLPSQESIYFNRNLPAGSVTDDTVFSLMLLEMLIHHGSDLDTRLFIETLSQWVDQDPKNVEVVGPSTLKAIAGLKKGIPIDRVGIMGTTNGAAMKIVPVALFYVFADEDTLMHAVHQICLPTHNTRVAMSGAILIAHLIRKFCRAELELKDIWDEAHHILNKSKHLGVDTAHAHLSSRIKLSQEIVMKDQSMDEKLNDIRNIIGTSIETIESIPAVMSLLYLSQGELKLCARLAANIGGDTDTIGALSCALGGAYKNTILQEEHLVLQSVNHFDFEDISQRFAKCILSHTY